MKSTKLDAMSKDELIELVQKLRKRKKYGLVWEDKLEDVVTQCQRELPVLEEFADRAIHSVDDQPTNIIIEGDNYHALSVLNYTHKGKIDVIYIDPPYNTGAKDWKYNNDYVDVNDRFRHSKWISMMHKRISLSKDLLRESGVILVAIDDHEVHNQRHILDQIFGESNFIASICIEINPAGQNIRQNTPAVSHDYCLIYAKDVDRATLLTRQLTPEEAGVYKESDEKGSFIWDNLRRRGGNSTPTDRPGQWYPLYVDLKSKKIGLTKFESATELWPIDPKGIKRIWRVSPEGFEREYSAGNISMLIKRDRIEIVKKSYAPSGRKPKTMWKEPQYSATSHGTKLLINILGKNNFTYPKSLHLVKDCLQYYSDRDSITLDFFAGSGTTGHAVLQLNKEDGGKRQFILCTNNENKIAEEVTYPRIKKVIEGYADVEGIPANVRYFRTAFVPRSDVSDDTRYALVERSADMICVREGTYEKVSDTKQYKIFTDGHRSTGILYDLESITAFKKALTKHGLPASLYIFTLSADTYEDEFRDLKIKHKLCPIPESILEVYRKLFRPVDEMV